MKMVGRGRCSCCESGDEGKVKMSRGNDAGAEGEVMVGMKMKDGCSGWGIDKVKI